MNSTNAFIIMYVILHGTDIIYMFLILTMKIIIILLFGSFMVIYTSSLFISKGQAQRFICVSMGERAQAYVSNTFV